MHCMCGIPAGAQPLQLLCNMLSYYAVSASVKRVHEFFRMSVPVKWQEEQAICCAGLTKPKLNVFQQAVQFVLVVCTTVEVC